MNKRSLFVCGSAAKILNSNYYQRKVAPILEAFDDITIVSDSYIFHDEKENKLVLAKNNKTNCWGLITLILMAVSIFIKPTDRMKWLGINDLALYGWSYSLGVTIYYKFGDIKNNIHLEGWQTASLCLVGGVFLY